MSKQLAVASAFSIFALSALALFPPSPADSHGLAQRTGATIEIAAPSLSAYWPLID
jgi:hypothetical protein